MQQDLLSQEEIDALLESVNAGDFDDERRLQKVGVRGFDIASQQRIVRGRLSALESINQRLARMTRQNLLGMFKRDVEVSSIGLRTQKYGEYLHSLYVPSSLTLIRLPPLRGTGLIVLDARLVFRLVDFFFGGSGRHAKVEGRDFTPGEIRVVNIFLHQVFADLVEAWKSVLALECESVGAEVNPAMAGIVGPTEQVVVSTFHIDLDGGGGDLQVVLPNAMLEPVRDILEASARGNTPEADRTWAQSLRRQVMGASVEIRCTVAEMEMNLREVAELKVGDVITLDTRPGSMMTANGVPVFRAKLGVANGNLAVQVLDKLNG